MRLKHTHTCWARKKVYSVYIYMRIPYEYWLEKPQQVER